MIEKLNPHYSFTTPASAHDEEALTALELAGRQGAKINELIEAQNELYANTTETLGRFEETTIPAEVEANMQQKLEDGTFNAAFNEYAGDLEGRLNNLLSSVPVGGTSMDAEIIDARIGQNGVNYDTLGIAIREQFKLENHRTRNLCVGAVNTPKGCVNFDIPNRRVSIGAQYYIGTFSMINVTSPLSCDYSDIAGTSNVYALCLVSPTEVVMTRMTDLHTLPAAIILCYAYFGTNYAIRNVFTNVGFTECVHVNGEHLKTGFGEVIDARYGQNGVIYNGLGTAIREQFKLNYHRNRNMCVGIQRMVLGDVSIDTAAKTLTLGNKYFIGQAGYYNPANRVLDYSGVTVSNTYCVSFNASGVYLHSPSDMYDNPAGIVLCYLFLGSNTNLIEIYAPEELKPAFRVDGKAWFDTGSKRNIGRHSANIFKKVVCCGDSFTRGYIQNVHTGVNQDTTDCSWPAFMARLTGAQYVNCGVSGSNVITWQTRELGLPAARNAGKAQAYIIGLGINDALDSSTHVDVGTIADIGTNATTYHGGLSQIIEALNNISPEAKIFVCTNPRTGARWEPYNEAVHNVVDHYAGALSVHCLDLYANIGLFNSATIAADALNGHYTAIGYEHFAEIIYQLMSDYINEHVEDFQDVAFIEYD